ncbi:MAG TPA: hypothetical protein VGM39_08820 [Kofleriaceae bacterium]
MKALLAIACLATGCATLTDSMWLLAGPKGGEQYSGQSVGTGKSTHAREVGVDPHLGLVCRDVETPYANHSRISTRVTNPNGYRLPMQILTGLEATLTGIYVAGDEYVCHRDGCDADHNDKYVYMLPLFADIAWGLYRSFTIHNEIVRSTEVEWPQNDVLLSNEDSANVTLCPVGTELPLVAMEDELVVHVGEHGFVVDTELDALFRFVSAHPTFSIASGVTFDAARLSELVAWARYKTEPVAVAKPATPSATTTVAAPPPTTIQVPSTICVDGAAAGVNGGVCVRAR